MKNITRRDFLKGLAATAAGVSAMGFLPGSMAFAEENTEEKTSWRTAPADIPESDISAVYEADVVILGAGHSGGSCARAAAENGATVIIVEEQPEETFALFGHEYGGINSKEMMKRWNVPAVDGDALYHDWMARNAFRANPAFVRAYVNESGPTFDWLLEAYDEEFISTFVTNGIPGPKYGPSESQSLRYWTSTIEMQDATKMSKCNLAMMKKASPDSKVLWGHSAERLVREGNRVVAAIVTDPDGKYIRLNARKGVVVATGGFAGNAEMCHDVYYNIVNKYPAAIRDKIDISYPMVPRMGKGHKICVWAGAAWEPDEPASMTWQNPCGMNPFLDAKMGLGNVWLNRDGKRYISEAGDLQIQGLEGRFAPMNDDGTITVMSVMDASLPEDLHYQVSGHGVSCIDDAMIGEGIAKKLADNMQKCIDAGDKGLYSVFVLANVYSGDTLEQLADRMGLSGEVKENFLASIERYNQMCDQKHDDDFFKDPNMLLPIREAPFFGYKTDYALSVGLTTVTGMWTDNNQRCIDDQTHEPIEGLYATGNVCGRRFIGQYATSIAGQSVAIANTLGRLLGIHLGTME